MNVPQVSQRALRALAAAQEAAKALSPPQEHHAQPPSEQLPDYASEFTSDISRLPGLTFAFKAEGDSLVFINPTVDVAVRLVVQRNCPASFHNSFLHWYASREQTLLALADRDRNIVIVKEHVDFLKEVDVKFALLWFQEGDTQVRFDFNQESEEYEAYDELVADLGDSVGTYLKTEC